MPSHQERREPLPKGYQFGDAAWSSAMKALDDSNGVVVGRTLQAGDGRVLWQLGHPKYAIHKAFGWNVIEGETHN